MRLIWEFFQRFLRHRKLLIAGVLCVPVVAVCDIWITIEIGDALTRLRAGDDSQFLRGVFLLPFPEGDVPQQTSRQATRESAPDRCMVAPDRRCARFHRSCV